MNGWKHKRAPLRSYPRTVLVLSALLLCVFFFLKGTLGENLDRWRTLRSIRKEVQELESLSESRKAFRCEGTEKDNLQHTVLTLLSCFNDSGCEVVKASQSKARESNDNCPQHILSLAFTGSCTDILSSLTDIAKALSSFNCKCVFRSVSMAPERSPDGKTWRLVCRTDIRVLPIMAAEKSAETDVEESTGEIFLACEPFLVPVQKLEQAAPTDLPYGAGELGNDTPTIMHQGRIVGSMGDRKHSVKIIELDGQYYRISGRDPMCIRQFGEDSMLVKLGRDTMMIYRSR